MDGGVADLGVGVRLLHAMLVSCPGLGLEPAAIERLEREEADLASLARRQEFLVAFHIEIAAGILDAEAAAPAASIRLDRLEPAFPALVAEGGADRSVLFELEMAILGVAGPEAHAVDEARSRVEFGAEILARLPEIERRRLRLDIGIE